VCVCVCVCVIFYSEPHHISVALHILFYIAAREMWMAAVHCQSSIIAAECREYL